MSDLGPIKVRRRNGSDTFRDGGRNVGFDLKGFWQWSASDLVSNATRGVLAEYIVAQALGIADGVREEWDSFDLTTKSGIKIEVKSASYIQSWYQKQFSRIVFRVPTTRAWNKRSNRQSKTARRQADIYIFALLAHTDQDTLDPLDVSQWEFFVVPTWILNKKLGEQQTVSLARLKTIAEDSLKYSEIERAVDQTATLRKKSG